MNQPLFLILIFLLLIDRSTPLTPEGLALLSLKSALSSSAAFSDWNESDPTPCQWTGIACSNISTSSRVVSISLPSHNLSGYLPSELANLLFLRRLNLHSNRLHGPIPSNLFNATSLRSLYLHANNLSGHLPPSLCHDSLRYLDISRNSLSGSLNSVFDAKCRKLQRLILAGNKFSGNIPVGIWSAMESLRELDLSANELNGAIPTDIGELKSLSGTLNLSYNHFSGEIPKSLGELPVTVSFDLRHNNLSGEIPETGSFSNQGPTAFLNNPLLCGFPIQKSCKTTTQVSPVITNNNSNDSAESIFPKKLVISSGLIVMISVADAVAVAFIGVIVIYMYWRTKDNSMRKLGSLSSHRTFCSCFVGGFGDSETDPDELPEQQRGKGGLVAMDKEFKFELDELLRASAYVLGRSGLGIVYKVVLGNGIPVAVRRLGEGAEERYKEFAAEAQAIGRVKHPNVVRLRAFYWAPDEKLLVSDFISHGNLASAIRGRNGQPISLSWSTRLKILKGTARGLAYLHEYSPRKIFHGDIRPSNILLDNKSQPYISDFGLNKLITITGNNPSSGGLIGSGLPYMKATQTEKSKNYKAPEARVPGSKPTKKCDVYSLGVVILELLTGKSPDMSPTSSASTSMEIPDLVTWVRKGFEDEKPLSEMVDPLLHLEVHSKKEVLAAFHVALSCTHCDPDVRPKMKTVSETLERVGSK